MPHYKTSVDKLTIRGNKEEKKLFYDCTQHYQMAEDDLNSRLDDFDKKDELFRSYINKTDWPYNSVVFDPRVFTFITEKTSRLLANKPKGRLIPREGGDTLGAAINNELLNFQWDDNERVDNNPMIAKWATMDMNTRKYGTAFGLAKWRHERRIERDGEKAKSNIWYDAPDFKPLVNRDCLPNPSYSTIKNWFQYRDYVTWQELTNVNDAARTKPVYKNLDLLKDALSEDKKSGGDTRSINWQSRNLAIKDIEDQLGKDESFKTVEIVTEYRNDRWITFAPKYGVILRDIPNPYKHGQIPIVMLRYYSVDDDLYGLSEIEPIERLQKATNALINQYLDAINMSLYAPLKVRVGAVKMHTLEFGPGKKWVMNDPSSDVIAHDQNTSGVSEFTSTYSFMISAIQNGVGGTSQGISNMSPFENDKTATEVRDMARQQLARDNYNQIFLSEALKKQMMFWQSMNQQFMFSNPKEQQKIIRIVGKDAMRYFQKRGLDGMTLPPEAEELMNSDEMIEDQASGGVSISPQELMQPMYPVNLNGESVPKMTVEEDGSMASLIVEPKDLEGNYDYIPDIGSMELPDQNRMLAQRNKLLEIAQNQNIQGGLAQEGYKLKFKEIIEDFLEDVGMKDADKYFEKYDINTAGAGGVGAGGQGQIPGQQPGMEAGLAPMAGAQAQPVVS